MFFFHYQPKEHIWKDDLLSSRLKRYKGIIDGDRYARYLIAKKVAVQKPTNSSTTDDLWKIHIEGHRLFNDLLMKIDDQRVDINSLPAPKYSYLDLKKDLSSKIIESCHFCERRCGVDRKKGEKGWCRVGKKSVVSSAFLHTGEESPLVPSGTIFFSGCVFKCVFCQNWSISQEWLKHDTIIEGNPVTPNTLANVQKKLSDQGAININWVGGDPIPNIHNIIASLQLLDLNIVQLWNSNMYLTIEGMNLLLDIIDFWLPDLKFHDNTFAKRISGIPNYWEVITRNIKYAYEKGSGEMIIRHLCMPGRIEEDTKPILDWVSRHVPNAFVNIMGQYHPDYKIRQGEYEEINRRPTMEEIQSARDYGIRLGISWRQVS